MATAKPRDCFRDTIVYTAPGSTDVQAVEGVQIRVYYANTNKLAEIYDSVDSVDARKNEFVLTSKSGLVEFYADVGEYDIDIQDDSHKVSSGRFRWNAVNTGPGGLPLSSLGQSILRQLVPIGQVIDWWRPPGIVVGSNPPTGVPLPAGFELCDGHTIPSEEHDFGTGQALVLPDLRNQFIIGADVLQADGTPSTAGDRSIAPATPQTVKHPNAPGIGGVGGGNAAKNLTHTHKYAHTHGVPSVAHTHSGTTANHLHAAGTLYMPDHAHSGRPDSGSTLYVADHSRGRTAVISATGDTMSAEEFAYMHGGTQVSAVVNGTTGTQGAQAIGIGGSTGFSGGITFTSDSQTSTATTTASQSGDTTDIGTLTNPDGVLTPLDTRPTHYGLLKLMKVRRS